MIQRASITLYSIGCLTILVSAAPLLIAIERATPRMPFLVQAPISSCDGAYASSPFGLIQVKYLTGRLPTSSQIRGEVQA